MFIINLLRPKCTVYTYRSQWGASFLSHTCTFNYCISFFLLITSTIYKTKPTSSVYASCQSNAAKKVLITHVVITQRHFTNYTNPMYVAYSHLHYGFFYCRFQQLAPRCSIRFPMQLNQKNCVSILAGISMNTFLIVQVQR